VSLPFDLLFATPWDKSATWLLRLSASRLHTSFLADMYIMFNAHCVSRTIIFIS
jgi:hypothetical protein